MKSDDHDLAIGGLRGVRVAVVASIPFFLVTQLKRQLLDLHGRGMDLVVLAASGPELNEIEWGERLRYVAVDIRRRPAPWRDLVAVVRIAWLIRKYKFQIVHSTTPKAGLLAAIAGWVMRVPVRLHTFTGQPWVTMTGPLRWVSRMSDRVIGLLDTRCYADSQSQTSYLIEQGIVSRDRIGVIGAGSLAGVDTTRFDRRRFALDVRKLIKHDLGIASDAIVLIFIGRVTPEKGIAELLVAWRALRAAGLAVELLLVGPLEIGHKPESRELERDILNSEGVHPLGYSNQPEKYLAIADILCLPSYREGFGTVVIEAAAMEVPTVGTRITGLSDAIVDGVTGLLVPPRDPLALERALRRLIEDPTLRTVFGKAARERCLREFDSRVVNERLAAEYLRLLTKTQVESSNV